VGLRKRRTLVDGGSLPLRHKGIVGGKCCCKEISNVKGWR
jgi:hypothetical protein